MKLYLNELAPWERKNEYFHHIKLGKDFNNQALSLRKAIDTQTKANLTSASAILASQERINDGIQDLRVSIEDGMNGLAATFEWGIAEVVWQLEQNRTILTNILEVLMAPLDTHAKERRKRAEKAYENGWIEDAEEEFLESEKLNKYDFAIHISLGIIYLFHKVDKNKALEYFDKAIKYARPESPYHTSYVLLHKALIKRDMNQLSDALEHTVEAIQLSPTFLEPYYQAAVYATALGKTRQAIDFLRKLVESDYQNCLRIDNDKDFAAIRTEVEKLFLEYKNKEVSRAKETISQTVNKLRKINSVLKGIDNLEDHIEEVEEMPPEISGITLLLQRDSLFDALAAQQKLTHCVDIPEKVIRKKQSEIRKVISKVEQPFRDAREKSDKVVSGIFGFGCLTWLAILGTIALCTAFGASVGGIVGGIAGFAFGCYAQSKVEDFFLHMEFDHPKREIEYSSDAKRRLDILNSANSALYAIEEK